MSIRTTQIVCSMNYQERDAYKAEHGVEILFPRVTWRNDCTPKVPSMSTPNADQHGRSDLDELFSIEDGEEFAGEVVDIVTERNVRIMSDVWADVTYAVLHTPGERSMFTRRAIYNSEMYSPSTIVSASIDAPKDVLDIYQVWKAAKEYGKVLARSASDDAKRLAYRREVHKGDLVRVVKGRKVPVGTEGKVFWMGNSGYGEKVGIALPREDGTFRTTTKRGRYGKTYESYVDVAWTALSNVAKLRSLGGRLV